MLRDRGALLETLLKSLDGASLIFDVQSREIQFCNDVRAFSCIDNRFSRGSRADAAGLLVEHEFHHARGRVADVLREHGGGQRRILLAHSGVSDTRLPAFRDLRPVGRPDRPRDLPSATVGVGNYGNTAALVVRALLYDRYDVAADEITWRADDVDRAERKTIPIPRQAKPFDISAMPPDAALGAAVL